MLGNEFLALLNINQNLITLETQQGKQLHFHVSRVSKVIKTVKYISSEFHLFEIEKLAFRVRYGY